MLFHLTARSPYLQAILEPSRFLWRSLGLLLLLLSTQHERYVWDVYQYPKVIDLHTGEIVASAPEVEIPSTLYPFISEEGPYALHADGQRLAVGQEEGIVVLTFDPSSASS